MMWYYLSWFHMEFLQNSFRDCIIIKIIIMTLANIYECHLQVLWKYSIWLQFSEFHEVHAITIPISNTQEVRYWGFIWFTWNLTGNIKRLWDLNSRIPAICLSENMSTGAHDQDLSWAFMSRNSTMILSLDRVWNFFERTCVLFSYIITSLWVGGRYS